MEVAHLVISMITLILFLVLALMLANLMKKMFEIVVHDLIKQQQYTLHLMNILNDVQFQLKEMRGISKIKEGSITGRWGEKDGVASD